MRATRVNSLTSLLPARLILSIFLVVGLAGAAYGQTVIASAYGFDPVDSTRFLQAAINSGADTVIVPNVGQDWIITPVLLTGRQQIIFEPGVVVAAKEGEFHGGHDMLFRATDKSHITLSGYGATLKMRKADYMGPEYTFSEWRHALNFDGCSNVTIEGLTIRDSGGDGLALSDSGQLGYNDNVTVRDVVFDNNYRQGISIISAQNVLIENSEFRNTSGTGPGAGIDLEPDHWDDRMANIVVRDCIADNNQGPGYVVSPSNLNSQSMDISVLFDNCDVLSGDNSGLSVTGVKDDGPAGTIEFVDCDVQDTYLYGIRLLDKSSTSARVRFENVTLTNVATGPDDATGYPGVPNLPMMIHLRGASWSTQPGGVDFVNVSVTDNRDRDFLAYREFAYGSPGIYDLQGDITVTNPYGVSMDLGPNQYNINLTIIEGTPEPTAMSVILLGAMLLLHKPTNRPARGRS